MEKEEIYSVLNEQREEVMAAKTLESDLDFAFNLQIQEAITASLNNNIIHHSNASTSHSPPPQQLFFTENDAVVFDYTTLLLEDLDRYDQERQDHEQCEAVMKMMREDLNRRIHDQKLASEIKNIPDDDWEKYGDNYERPYNADKNESESESERESCRLYFKGIVSEERIRDMRVVVAGIGVAICDPKDNLMFEMRKGLEDGYRVSSERAELEALVEGLNMAISLNLERVCFFVDDYLVYQYVSP